MLYVFDVANGTMITFDPDFSFQSMFKLKEEIERKCDIRVDYQVLLMSSGESLEPDTILTSYSTGTDTNPLYLINKALNESSSLFSSKSILNHENMTNDLQNKVSDSSNMQLNYQTLVERTQISHEFFKLGSNLYKVCKDLVEIQHFQHKGWAAAVIHLESLVKNCDTNGKILEQTFDSHIVNHQEYLNILKNVDMNMEILRQIPLLPELKKSLDNASTAIVTDAIKDEQSNEELTLLKWISVEKLKKLREQCARGFKRFNNRWMTSLRNDIYTLSETVTKINLKEIKHVRERLYVREQIMKQMRKLLKSQAKIAEKFVNDYNRGSKIKDKENIADMCLIHHSWLQAMLRNHIQLHYFWKRCIKDKDKLYASIQLRIRWFVKTESKIIENNAKIITYNENLNRLYKDLEILRQVDSAPKMYANAVTEVVRRRNFSQQFLTWSSNIVGKMQFIYSQETERRQEFQRKFEGHFLNELFSGFEDVPPLFASELPVPFDDRLPHLTMDDLNYLNKQLSNLNFNLPLPNFNMISKSFISKEIVEQCEKDECKNKNNSTLKPNSKNHNKISEILQILKDSFKIQTNNIFESNNKLEIMDESELFEFKTSLKNQDNKISSLKSILLKEDITLKEDATSSEDNMLQTIKRKFNFQQENTKKLWLIYKEMEVKIRQIKLCQEKLMKEAQDMKLLKSMFKKFLEEFQNKCKNLFHQES